MGAQTQPTESSAELDSLKEDAAAVRASAKRLGRAARTLAQQAAELEDRAAQYGIAFELTEPEEHSV